MLSPPLTPPRHSNKPVTMETPIRHAHQTAHMATETMATTSPPSFHRRSEATPPLTPPEERRRAHEKMTTLVAPVPMYGRPLTSHIPFIQGYSAPHPAHMPMYPFAAYSAMSLSTLPHHPHPLVYPHPELPVVPTDLSMGRFREQEASIEKDNKQTNTGM